MKSRINTRVAITPKIVGYCFDDTKRAILMNIAQELDTDICFVGAECAGEKVGYIAGINGMTAAGNKMEDPPECEVLIMSGLKSTVIDKVLKRLRENNISIELKCTVTSVNQNWEIYRLIEELQREHKAMNERKKA